MLAGLEQPSFGDIRILGMNPKKELKKIWSHCGFYPSNCTLCGVLSVQEYLEYFCLLKGFPQSTFDEVIYNQIYSVCFLFFSISYRCNIMSK